MNLKKTLAGLAVASLTAAVPAVTCATPVTYHFEFSSTDGPLQFGPNVGSFTFDDSVVPAGGGNVLATGLFTDLAVSFGAWSFDETTANSGWLMFDGSGGLIEAHFGNHCGAGTCNVTWGQPDWWIRVGVPGSTNDFAYSGFNGATGFHQTTANRLLPNEAPEPGSIALLAAALVGLAGSRRRG